MHTVLFAREHFKDMYEEAKPLTVKHYEEIAWNREKIPLVVGESTYNTLDSMDRLFTFTARVGGKLKGYSLYVFSPHLHYQETIFAQNDVIYLDPQYRGLTGSKFVAYCERELKALGASVITYHVKALINFGPMLERRGYEAADRIWQKYVGD